MASNSGSIDEIIGQKAIEGVDKTIVKMEDLYKVFVQNVAIVAAMKQALGDMSALKDIAQSISSLTAATGVGATATRQYTQAMADQAVERQRQINEMKNISRESSATVGAYANLEAEYKRLEKVSKDLGVQFGVNSQQFRDAAKASNEVLNGLKAIDAQMGNARRNVGNYGQAVFSLSQVFRELPAFTYSSQQGILAISNNLPILIDNFQMTARAINDTTGEINGNLGALKIFAKSILSFGNIMTIAIGLFTIYHKEIMEFFVGTNKAADATKKLSEALAGSEMTGAIENYTKLRNSIEFVNSGLMTQEEGIKLYNETIGKVTEGVDNWKDAEDGIVLNLDNWLKMMELKVKANEMLSISAKATAEALEAKESDPSIWQKTKAFALTYLVVKNYGKSREELHALRKKYEEQFKSDTVTELELEAWMRRQSYEDMEKERLAFMKKMNLHDERGGKKDGKKGDKKSLSQKEIDRFDELKKLYERENKIAETEYKKGEVSYIGYQKRLLDIAATFAKSRIALGKANTQKEIDSAVDLDLGIAKKASDAIENINKDLAKSFKETSKLVAKDASANVTRDAKEYNEKLQKAIAELNAAGVKIKIVPEIDKDKLTKDILATLEAINAAADAIGTIGDIIASRELMEIERRTKAQKEYYDNEIRFIEQSGMSEYKKSQARKKLDAENEARQKQIDRDKVTSLRKQASLQKASDILSITTSTAAAIIGMLDNPGGYPGIALSIGAGITGAAQLAKAIATPLPQYAKGRGKGKNEFAVVGEAGIEAIQRADGTMELTPNKPTLTYLNADDEVISNKDLMRSVTNAAYINLANGKKVTTDNMQMAMLQAYEENTKQVKGLREDFRNKEFKAVMQSLDNYDGYIETKLR